MYSVEIGNKEFLRKLDRGIVFVSENSKRNVIIQVHLHVNQVSVNRGVCFLWEFSIILHFFNVESLIGSGER